MLPKLKFLIDESRKLVASMTPKQKEAMLKAQAESWIRPEPKPKFKYVDGVKVYDSMEDFRNG